MYQQEAQHFSLDLGHKNYPKFPQNLLTWKADNDQKMPEVEVCFDNPKTIAACRHFLKINPLWFNYEGAFPLRYSFWSWHLPKQHCA